MNPNVSSFQPNISSTQPDPDYEYELTLNQQRLRDTLIAYSEWLDHEGLLPVQEGDKRTHDDLVTEFLDWLES